MNPYQVVGGIACCTLIFAGVVGFLTVQGVPLIMAFLSVYLVAIWMMMGMQRRARQLFEENNGRHYRRIDEGEVISRGNVDEDNVIDANDAFSGRGHLQA